MPNLKNWNETFWVIFKQCVLLRWQFSSSKITILLFIVRKKKFCVWYRVVGLELVVVAHGSKSDNFDKSMCTKAKNPFGVLPLVTQKLDWRALLCIERRKLHKKCQQFFPFEIQVQSFVFCIEILTSRNVNVDRLTREYFYSTKPTKSNDFFFNLYNLVNFRYLLISKQKIESEKSWPYSAWIQKRHIFNFHIV